MRLRIALVLALSMTAGPAPASGPHDGQWEVAVEVQRGACDQGFVFPIRVEDGAIRYVGEIDITATGKVGRDGRLNVRFTRQAESVSVSGRLTGGSGSGVWTAPSRDCAGRWQARRL